MKIKKSVRFSLFSLFALRRCPSPIGFPFSASDGEKVAAGRMRCVLGVERVAAGQVRALQQAGVRSFSIFRYCFHHLPSVIFHFRLRWPVRHALAAFGTARLVKKSDGRHELIGGTAHDHAAACEWCSLFAPEVVFTSTTPRRNSAIAFAA